MTRILPKNLGWKLGSLLLAVLLWIAATAEPDIVTERNVPVPYRNLRSQFLVSDAPQRMYADLSAPSGRLTTSNLSDAIATFDLRDIDTPGERTFTISSANMDLPTGVTFLQAYPSQLRLRFSRLATKDVPVEIRF